MLRQLLQSQLTSTRYLGPLQYIGTVGTQLPWMPYFSRTGSLIVATGPALIRMGHMDFVSPAFIDEVFGLKCYFYIYVFHAKHPVYTHAIVPPFFVDLRALCARTVIFICRAQASF